MNEESKELERLRDWLQVIANGPHAHPKWPDTAPEGSLSNTHPGPCNMGCPVWAAKRALEGE